MKIVDGKLYIEFKELVECGVNPRTITDAKSKEYKSWGFLKDPDDNRRVLIDYEMLADKYQDLVKARHGDPYQHVLREPILKRVKHCKEAQEYYMRYRYAEGTKALPIDVVKKYVRAEAWLRFLYEAKYDKNIIGVELGFKKLPDFYTVVKELIDREKERGKDKSYEGAEQVPGTFSSSYSRIMMNVDKYKKQSYDYLIDPSFGNSNSAKIKKGDVSEALLLELIEHHNQYDNVFIMFAYNKKADELGLEPISESTVYNHRKKNDHLLVAGREGWGEYNKKYAPRVHRMRPSQPTYLWESDDNHLDLYFEGADGGKHQRMKAIFVTDSSCDLVLGYAYLDSGSLHTDVVRMAYLQAMYYVRAITGGQHWYVPHEIKTDRWGLKELQPFYTNIAHYYPTPVGSKNRGWLENFFGCVDWKRCMKFDASGAPATNYSGNNITAKRLGVNLEMVRINEKLRPQVSEAAMQIAAFVHRLRHIDLKNKGSREQLWLDKWNALPDSEKRVISDETFLACFGMKHELPAGRTNSIDKSGVTITVGGQKFRYQVPEAVYFGNVGKKVEVMYDPIDMSRVLVLGAEGMRFVAQSVELVPGTMKDMKLYGGGGRALLNKTIQLKKAGVDNVANAAERRMQVLSMEGVDVEHVLRMGGKVQKELHQQAEDVYVNGGQAGGGDLSPALSQGEGGAVNTEPSDWEQQRRDYFKRNVDLSGYGDEEE